MIANIVRQKIDLMREQRIGVFRTIPVERKVMYTCVVCGNETDTPKTLMDNGMHRYVCSSKCMADYYK